MISLFIAFSLLTPMPDTAKHFKHGFSSSQVIKAPIDKVWAIETDVEQWPRWDKGLQAASLKGPLVVGTSGMLTDDKGRRSRFSISDLVPGERIGYRIKLPLATMHLARQLEVQPSGTRITHSVWFTGLLGPLFNRLLGKTYEPMLPETTLQLKALAETK